MRGRRVGRRRRARAPERTKAAKTKVTLNLKQGRCCPPEGRARLSCNNITEIPGQCTTQANARCASSYSTPMALSHGARIELALAEIGEKTAPNYAYYAGKYKLVPSTIS